MKLSPEELNCLRDLPEDKRQTVTIDGLRQLVRQQRMATALREFGKRIEAQQANVQRSPVQADDGQRAEEAPQRK